MTESKNFWSKKSKPLKTRLQEAIVKSILLDRKTDFYKEDRGLNVVVLGGPNFKKVAKMYYPLIKQGGCLHSAELDERIVREQKKQLATLPEAIRNVADVHHEDWFAVAERQVRLSLDLYLEMDFCNTVEHQWGRGLGKLRRVVKKVNPRVRKVHSSVTHSFSRRRTNANTRQFLLTSMPKVWESAGWVCTEKRVKPYCNGAFGGLSMLTAIYTFERAV